ncbi:ABC-type transport system substrate-binding protein [Acinetobacter calcoaceticus]|uniref:ABC-type transport system substrate-binding protein n=1 Tax=Acinetobacter calcoaceticus TaxID=471 RepID=A0A4V2R104_ACICA|nr:ABC-type transport system substrate-binding protein [Acinetobacter calcoaceticus]
MRTLLLNRDLTDIKQRPFPTKIAIHTLLTLAVLTTSTLSSLATSAADPNKVLRTYIPAAETGFDPVATGDLYSSMIQTSFFETLYSYDYLAAPAKLIPLTAAAMPEISADGLTYTIRIKKGIYFNDDPVFKGKKRELSAYDYAYSFKRILDPNLHSRSTWMLENKFQGLSKLVDEAKKTGRFNYDAAVAGIQTPDRYTLVLRLTQPDFNLAMMLAHTPTSAVAREVIEKYKDNRGYVMGRPIGTGAYELTKWVPGSRMILTARPDYRGYIWNFKAGADPEDKKIVAQMQGKKMPQIGVVDIQVIDEYQSQWLAFKQKQLDWVELNGDIASMVIKNGKLNADIAKTGAYLSHSVDPEIMYTFWNGPDSVIGGTSKEKVALRRAIAMAFSKQNYIEVVMNGNAVAANFLAPQGVVGYDPHYKSSIPYSVPAANLLLDQFNYKKGSDGYRRQPNGQALTIEYTMTPRSDDLKSAEFWKRTFDQIGIRFKTQTMQFPDYLKAQKQCKVQMGMQRWIADYPDADNFFQLFYSKNISSSNIGCVTIPQFDALYERSRSLPNGAERDALYQKMTRLTEAYTAITPILSRYNNTVVQPYVIGFKAHPILKTPWLYVDLKK